MVYISPSGGEIEGAYFSNVVRLACFFTPEGRLYGFINDKRFKSICEDIVK